MSRHEEFCWWLAGYLRAQSQRDEDAVDWRMTEHTIREELVRALHGAKVERIMEPGDGLSERSLQSLGGPWSGGERVSGKHRTVVGVDMGSEPGVARSFVAIPQAYPQPKDNRSEQARQYVATTQSEGYKLHDVIARTGELEKKVWGALERLDVLDRFRNGGIPYVSRTAFEGLARRIEGLESLKHAAHQQKDERFDKLQRAVDGLRAELQPLSRRCLDIEQTLRRAQDMAASMHKDKDGQLENLRERVRQLQEQRQVTSETVQNLNKRIHDLEQDVFPGHRPAPANSLPGLALRILTLEGHADPHRQGQLDNAFNAQRGELRHDGKPQSLSPYPAGGLAPRFTGPDNLDARGEPT